jgi:hypothetical protein
MSAADACQRLIDAVDARDWATAARVLDARTEVTDHRDLPFEGTGADVLRVWRATFDGNAAARARLDVLDADDHHALVRMRFGDDEGELTVHVVAEVDSGHIDRFDAYERGPAGERDARAHFADR